MALYFGNSEKLKINFDNAVVKLRLFYESPIINGAKLLSLENYILKDSNGLYLTVKEDK